MNKSIKSAQGGFTLIELIVVIVILGILAATALPRFTNLSGDARVASLNAARGALNATAAMTHGRHLLTPTATQNVEGAVVTMNAASGYPDVVTTNVNAAANTGLLQAAGLAGDYVIIAEGTATATRPLIPTGSVGIVASAVANTALAVNCFMTYTPGRAANTAPVVALAATATADNCQ